MGVEGGEPGINRDPPNLSGPIKDPEEGKLCICDKIPRLAKGFAKAWKLFTFEEFEGGLGARWALTKKRYQYEIDDRKVLSSEHIG